MPLFAPVTSAIFPSNLPMRCLIDRPPVGSTQIPAAMRQGDRSFQLFNAWVVHAVVLSVWHRLHALGICSASVSAGVMNLKVWARTFTSAIVCSILGMWHATHWLPALPGAWCVCASRVGACGPFCVFGP